MKRELTAFGDSVTPFDDASLTGTLRRVCRENGTRAVTELSFAGTNVVHAIFVECLGIYKYMTIRKYLISQLSTNFLCSRFILDVHLAWMWNYFIIQGIAGILCLPFVCEWMDSCFNIPCRMQNIFSVGRRYELFLMSGGM
jgi:hypothetical protein